MSTTVMVVDDSFTIREQVSRALEAAGYDVLQAVDGVDALEKYRASPQISLVVCDVNMPRMSGIEFLEQAREVGSAPVVMLTTEGQVELIRRAKSLGASGWITKPFKADLLVAAARKLAPQG